MSLKTTLISLATLALSATQVFAQNFDSILQASLLPGWRQADGTHMAAIHLQLEPGWHTYWRAPGDAGIPPGFDLSGSRNLTGMHVIWPRPEVYMAGGMRSIVYHDQVILPIKLSPKKGAEDIKFNAEISIGVCKDICVPQTLSVAATLPQAGGKRDPRIAAALADRPYSAKEAGASNVRCALEPNGSGMTLTTTLTLPKQGQREAMIIETANPLLWVAEPDMQRSGNRITARTRIEHVEGAPFVVNRSGIRITVLGERRAVDIKGCRSAS